MTLNNKQIELAEAYATDRLTGANKVDFEQQMAQNTELQREVQFQQDIAQGFDDYKATQIKARLNQLQPTTSIHWLKPSIVAAAAGAAIVIAISLWPNSQQNQLPTNSPTQQYTKPQTQVDATKNQGVANNDETVKETPQAPQAAKQTPTQTPSNKQRTNTVPSKTNTPAQTTHRTFDYSQVAPPDVNEPLKDNLSPNTKNHPHTENSATIVNKTAIEINIKPQKRGKSYTLTNGVLTLYGSFDKSPYEVLNLSKTDQYSLYLYYEQIYYKLNSTNADPEKLSPINDKKVIEKLDLFRLNK